MTKKAPETSQKPPLKLYTIAKIGGEWVNLMVTVSGGQLHDIEIGTPSTLDGAIADHKIAVSRELINRAKTDPYDYGSEKLRDLYRVGSPELPSKRMAEVWALFGVHNDA